MHKTYSIIDYGAGNILSVQRALNHCNFRTKLVKSPKEIQNASYLILPGDGSFKFASESLKKLKITDKILNHVKKGNPLIGICLGMQFLMSSSEEHGSSKGLSIIEGKVRKIDLKKNYINKVPVVGWNNTFFKKNNEKKFNKLNSVISKKNFYYVHSYSAEPKNQEEILAYYKYGNKKIVSIVVKENVIGFQFHPEKSGKNGLNLIKKMNHIGF
jgi:glutamine amidotransferase